MTALSTSCNGPVNPDKFPDPGHVIATVTDQNNAAVTGANVQLLFPENGFVWRSALTDANGKGEPGQADGGVLPGSYNANVVAPTGYTVATTQQNPIPIAVQSNKTVTLSFKLTKAP